MPSDSPAAQLQASRAHLNRITEGLEGERLLGPRLAIVNPPLWELGHVAYFQEYWCLRRRGERVVADSILPGADALYDSAKVAHDTRWNLPLPDLAATRAYQQQVLERVLERLEREPDHPGLLYFAQLAAFHEDMHAEAFHYTRQTLGYEDPFQEDRSLREAHEPLTGDAELPGGVFQLGARPEDGFVFDNEKWAHEVRIAPFRIARAPVTNAGFLAFVEAGGYTRREWWSEEGWSWRTRENRLAPAYWMKRDGVWCRRRFDRIVPLEPDEPVIHVNWHEAQAWCRYAGRRLPTEAEWEYAACSGTVTGKPRYPWGDAPPDAARANLQSGRLAPVGAHAAGDAPCGCRQLIGNLWEWTADTFGPYPGFVADPYKEYSQPWFGTHKVLRGGSFATPRRLIRNTWRNFYTPDRCDIFAGFRTCAREPR